MIQKSSMEYQGIVQWGEGRHVTIWSTDECMYWTVDGHTTQHVPRINGVQVMFVAITQNGRGIDIQRSTIFSGLARTRVLSNESVWKEYIESRKGEDENMHMGILVVSTSVSPTRHGFECETLFLCASASFRSSVTVENTTRGRAMYRWNMSNRYLHTRTGYVPCSLLPFKVVYEHVRYCLCPITFSTVSCLFCVTPSVRPSIRPSVCGRVSTLPTLTTEQRRITTKLAFVLPLRDLLTSETL